MISMFGIRQELEISYACMHALEKLIDCVASVCRLDNGD